MQIFKVPFNGIKVTQTNFFEDERGKFGEIFSKKVYAEAGIDAYFVQDNYSISNKNFLRGLHYRRFKPQAQLLTILEGEIFDVIVDLRLESKTYGKWYSVHLSANAKNQIFMDIGFAHGYYVKSSVVKIHYKVSEFYDPKDDFGIRWNDPNLNISWPVKRPLLKDRDAEFPFFDDNKNLKFLEY
jgi:dTDP-4-dehydrorhamnose 3,5-epimerase